MTDHTELFSTEARFALNKVAFGIYQDTKYKNGSIMLTIQIYISTMNLVL